MTDSMSVEETSAEETPVEETTSVRRVSMGHALPWLRTAVRVGLGGVWVVAGALKAADLGQSVQSVVAYEVMPMSMARLIGWGLPFVEVALGLILISGIFTRWAALASGALQLVMMVGLVSAWSRGLSIDCGCFSAGGEVAPEATTYLRSLIRDFVFLLAAAWLVWQPVTRFSLDAVTGGIDELDEESG